MNKQTRFYKKGELVELTDEAFDVLPGALAVAQHRAWTAPMKILDAFPVPADDYPFMQDLTLEGAEDYTLPSSCVKLAR